MLPDRRPRGIGEMLDAAVALYRRCFRTLMWRALLVVVPFQVVIMLLNLSALPDADGTTVSNTALFAALGALVLAALLRIGGMLALTAAIARPIASAYTGYAGPTARPPVGQVAILVLTTSVCVFMGLAMCGVPGLALFALWAAAIPAQVIEGLPAFRALGRAQRLTARSYLMSLGLVTTAALIMYAIDTGLSIGISMVVTNGGTTAQLIAQGFAGIVSTTLIGSIFAAALVVLYFDLRIRREGFDIQMLMYEAPAAAGPGIPT